MLKGSGEYKYTYRQEIKKVQGARNWRISQGNDEGFVGLYRAQHPMG